LLPGAAPADDVASSRDDHAVDRAGLDRRNVFRELVRRDELSPGVAVISLDADFYSSQTGRAFEARRDGNQLSLAAFEGWP